MLNEPLDFVCVYKSWPTSCVRVRCKSNKQIYVLCVTASVIRFTKSTFGTIFCVFLFFFFFLVLVPFCCFCSIALLLRYIQHIETCVHAVASSLCRRVLKLLLVGRYDALASLTLLPLIQIIILIFFFYYTLLRSFTYPRVYRFE